MEKIFLSPKIKKILLKLKNRQKLEKSLKAKFDIEGKNVIVSSSGLGFSEYLASKVLQALDFGFNLETALALANSDYILEIIDIKKFARASRFHEIKGRLIGKEGKAKAVVARLTECEISITDHMVAMIGKAENIILAKRAINLIIRGTPHSKVYAFLEKNRVSLARAKEEAEDLEDELERLEEQQKQKKTKR